jgi:ribosomal protein L37AE/L43A
LLFMFLPPFFCLNPMPIHSAIAIRPISQEEFARVGDTAGFETCATSRRISSEWWQCQHAPQTPQCIHELLVTERGVHAASAGSLGASRGIPQRVGLQDGEAGLSPRSKPPDNFGMHRKRRAQQIWTCQPLSTAQDSTPREWLDFPRRPRGRTASAVFPARVRG